MSQKAIQAAAEAHTEALVALLLAVAKSKPAASEDDGDDDEPKGKKKKSSEDDGDEDEPKGKKKKSSDDGDDDEIDLDSLRALAKKLLKADPDDGESTLEAILKKFDTESLTDLDKDNYEAVHAKLTKALAAAE